MSEPPASSDFTSRRHNDVNTGRSKQHSSSSSSSQRQRADPPSDPPDSRHTTSRRLVTADPTVVRVSPSSLNRPTVTPPLSKRRDAPALQSASTSSSSALPTFKGQVSGGSILKIEGRKVAMEPPVLSEQVKKAMEEARQQQQREHSVPSILTDKHSNRTSTSASATKKNAKPIVNPPPPLQEQQRSSQKNLNTAKPKIFDLDDAKSVTLVEPLKPEINRIPPVPHNPATELAPTIPAQYQKKKATTAEVNKPHPHTASSSSQRLEDTWEFDTTSSSKKHNTSESSCCTIT